MQIYPFLILDLISNSSEIIDENDPFEIGKNPINNGIYAIGKGKKSNKVLLKIHW